MNPLFVLAPYYTIQSPIHTGWNINKGLIGILSIVETERESKKFSSPRKMEAVSAGALSHISIASEHTALFIPQFKILKTMPFLQVRIVTERLGHARYIS